MFAAFESSRKKGAPVHLYLFRLGQTGDVFFAYTNAPYEITHDDGSGIGPQKYVPEPMTHGAVKSNGDGSRTRVLVRGAFGTELSFTFRQGIPEREIFLVVYVGHEGDPDEEFVVEWSGRVVGGKQTGTSFEYATESTASDMRRPGLRRNYQRSCPLVLYDGGSCRADKAAATHNADIVSADRTVLQMPVGWDNGGGPENFRNGGLLEYTNAAGTRVFRTIRSAGATSIVINAPVFDLADGDTVSLSFGCNRQTSHCENLHKEVGTGRPNINNFGGQPEIPVDNPLSTKNVFF